MSEKLSQGQIDALFKRVSSGEVTAPEVSQSKGKKVKEYDFHSPKKFTKEQLKALDSLHENFSRVISSYFSGLLRMVCEVSVLQIEEQRYYEYNNALPDSALIALVDLKPEDERYSEATLIMDMSKTIGYLLIDRLLGGPGKGTEYSRDYTEIELNILQYVFNKITERLEVAWRNYIDVTCSLGSMETNSRLLQVLSPEDVVVIVVLNVKLKNLSGNLNICIPAVSLEELIDSFSNKYTRASKKQNNEQEELKRRAVFDTLLNSDLEIKTVLHEFEMELRDVLHLRVNDVIPLDKNIASDVQVFIDENPWFSAKLGSNKMKKAVKINNLLS